MPQQEITTYGLIGNPIAHSLSPLMHNTAFKALKVEAVYKLFPLEENELDDFFARLREKDCLIFGFNVTVPYKEKILPYLDSLSPYAQKTRAVNTVVISDKRRLAGYNTDGPGFFAHLKELGFDIKNKRVAILGAGGASRAIISSLCILPERPASVKIYDLYPEKAETLISDLGRQLDVDLVEAVHSIDDLNIELADLLINATPIGMKKNDLCLVEPEVLHENMLVYDVIYNPLETKLLKMAKKKGAQVANGLGMLFYQGVLALQHWTNTEIDEQVKEKMRKSLEKGAGL